MDRGVCGATVHGVANSQTRLSDFTHSLMQLLGLPWWLRGQSICRQCGFNHWVRKTPWRRKWQPTPVLLPGKSHGQRSLVGYSRWDDKESDTIERLHFLISIHDYWKNHSFDYRTFVAKVVSLLFLFMLFRFVITFLPRSKHLLISWLQSPSAVILEPKKIKSDTVSTVSPSISHEVMGPDAMIFVF